MEIFLHFLSMSCVKLLANLGMKMKENIQVWPLLLRKEQSDLHFEVKECKEPLKFPILEKQPKIILTGHSKIL